MKIRNGFVSNSSSSSYILVVSLTDHNKAMMKLSKDDWKWMNEVTSGLTPQSLGSQMVLVIPDLYREESIRVGSLEISCETERDDVPENYWEFDWGFWHRYQKLLPKNGYVYEGVEG